MQPIPPVPYKTELRDPDGNLNRPWLLFFEAIREVATSANSTASTALTTATTTTTAPGDVSIIAVTPMYRSLPDAYGNILLDAQIEYTIPAAWTGDGVHVYDEFPDQSAGLVMGLAASAISGGPLPGIGDAILAGEWTPVDQGQYPYDAAAVQHFAFIRNLVAPTKAQDLRVYLVGYNSMIDPKPMRAGIAGASPTFVTTIQSPLALGGAPTIPDLTNFSATAGTPYDRGDGKLIQPVVCTFDPPTSDQIAGVWFEAISDDPLAPPDRHSVPVISLASGQFTFRMDATIALHNVVIYARTFDGSGNVNPISAQTPQSIIQIGSVAGTLNLQNTLASSVAAYFTGVGGPFRVTPQGIDNTLIANLTITGAQLATAAVTATKIANLAVSTANIQAAAITTALIANAAITNVLIANAAITDAKISDLAAGKITAGTINAVDIRTSTFAATSGTFTVQVDNTNFVKVTDTASGSVQLAGPSVACKNVTATLNGTLSPSTVTLANTISGGGLAQAKLTCGVGADPTLTLQDNTGATYFQIATSSGTSATATAGANTLPSNPLGFLIVTIQGVSRKIPFYST